MFTRRSLHVVLITKDNPVDSSFLSNSYKLAGVLVLDTVHLLIHLVLEPGGQHGLRQLSQEQLEQAGDHDGLVAAKLDTLSAVVGGLELGLDSTGSVAVTGLQCESPSLDIVHTLLDNHWKFDTIMTFVAIYCNFQ